MREIRTIQAAKEQNTLRYACVFCSFAAFFLRMKKKK
jgi:hypothetical protein